MKRHLTIFKSLLFLFALTAIAIGLVLVPRSTAKSNPHGRRTNPVAQVKGEKGTIVAQPKEYDPTVRRTQVTFLKLAELNSAREKPSP
jgi:hypothetical protein